MHPPFRTTTSKPCLRTLSLSLPFELLMITIMHDPYPEHHEVWVPWKNLLLLTNLASLWNKKAKSNCWAYRTLKTAARGLATIRDTVTYGERSLPPSLDWLLFSLMAVGTLIPWVLFCVWDALLTFPAYQPWLGTSEFNCFSSWSYRTSQVMHSDTAESRRQSHLRNLWRLRENFPQLLSEGQKKAPWTSW